VVFEVLKNEITNEACQQLKLWMLFTLDVIVHGSVGGYINDRIIRVQTAKLGPCWS